MTTQVFAGKFSNLVYIAELVRSAAAEAGFDSTSAYQIETAVDEACSNIIEHAYGGESERTFEFSSEISADRLTITLRDNGKPFKPAHNHKPNLKTALDERDNHGLGIYFIQQWMDEVTYAYVDGHNVLSMAKIRPIPQQMQAYPHTSEFKEWQQFLALGEAILKQPYAASQVALIQRSIQERFDAKAKIWLARPYFPLPGEPEVEILDENAPLIVQQALEQSVMLCQPAPVKNEPPRPSSAAIPLVTQEFVLGMLLVERSPDKPFLPEELVFLEGMAASAALALQISRQVVLKNWRFDQLTLVRSVGAQIANVFDLDQLCQQVSRLIQESFHYYSVSIYTLNTQDDQLHLRGNARQTGCSECSPSLVIPPGTGMIGSAAETGVELIAQDVAQEPRYRHSDALPETQSEACFPLKVGAVTVGVLDIQMDHTGAFHEIDRMVLSALADQIALAVEGTRLYSTLRQRADQVEAVSEVAHALTSILDFDRLMEQVVQVIQKRFGFSYVHLFTIQSMRRKIFYVAGTGEDAHQIAQKGLSFDLDDPCGLIPLAVRTGKTVLVNDVTREPLYRPADMLPDNTCSELIVPLTFGEEVLGVLDIQSDQLNAFDESQRSLFEGLGGSIAIAVRNATLYRSETWRRQVADSFRDVAALISANIAVDELLKTILEKLENNLPCDASAIWLLDDLSVNAHALDLAAVRGIETEKITQVLESQPAVREWLERAMASSEPTIRKSDDPYDPLGTALGFPADYSSIAVPLRAGGQLLGTLTLAHRTSGRYGSEARAMTTTFANYAAVAIQNARLYAATQEQAWIATVLLQVAEASQATSSIEELLDTMVRLTPLLVGVNKCAFFLWDEERQAFELSSRYGFDSSRSEKRLFDAELPAFARLRSTQSSVFVQDALLEMDMEEAATPDGDGTLVLMPLTARGEILGAFLVAHQGEHQLGIEKLFDQQTLSILLGIAHQTSVAVENIHLLDTRQEEAYVTAVLLQVAQAVVSQNNLHDVLDTIVHLLPILVGIDACAIYLWDYEEEVFQTSQAFISSPHEGNDLNLRNYRSQEFPLLDTVRASDTLVVCPQPAPVSIDEWPSLACLAPGEIPNPRQDNASNWLLGFPLSVKGEVYGVLVTQETGVPLAFHERRLELVNGVAQQVALALQNERYKLEMVRTERLDREIQLARQIQQTFLPSHLPVIPEWELDIRWETARQVGGDFYDIFKLSKGRLGMVIADVSDKGLAAALYMTVTRTLIRAYMHSNESPARVLEKVNNLLLSDAQNGMFVTAIYAILSVETGQITCANAGHNLPLLLRSDQGTVEQLPKGGMALGVMEDIHYQDYVIDIHPCDTLLLYTDGLTEAFSSDGETFGEERLHAILGQAQCGSVTDLLEKLDTALREFRKGNQPSDDMTVVALRRKSSS